MYVFATRMHLAVSFTSFQKHAIDTSKN